MKFRFETFFYQTIIITFLSSSLAYSGTPDESEFQAASSMGYGIAKWISKLTPPPQSVAVFAVHANAPLDDDYAGIIENETMKSMIRRGILQVSSCAECRSPQIRVEENRVIVSRGTQDKELIKNMSKIYAVDAFLVIELYRTKLSVLAQAMLYSSQTGVLIAGEEFKEPALNFNDASVQVLLSFGPGKLLSGKGASTTAIPLAGNLLLLEELGFGKGGLNFGSVFGGPSTFIYMNPTLAFRGKFAASTLFWSLNIGIGYAFTSEAKGISFRGAWEFYLGSLTVVGVEAMYFYPSQSVTSTFGTYGGFHIGISLGR